MSTAPPPAGGDPSRPWAQGAPSGSYLPAPPHGLSQPYGPPQPYGRPQPYGPPQPDGTYPVRPGGTNGFAIASLVLALTFAPLGLIFGLIALGQIRRTGQDGYGLALAGSIVGGIFTALIVVYFVLIFVLLATVAST